VKEVESFDPRPAGAPHHFEICCGTRGHWIVRDQAGLVGGVFVTRRDAIRFALGEAAGDPACIHLRAEPPPAADNGSR
jgi:hypothetical protein